VFLPAEWLARRDQGLLLPDSPPLQGMPEINRMPGTDTQRKRPHPRKVKPPNSFAPTVQKVREIVPNKLIPKLKPMMSLQLRNNL
jgi:hypothetical protein